VQFLTAAVRNCTAAVGERSCKKRRYYL